jgi:D-lactate dehydrogenase (cytochrome)
VLVKVNDVASSIALLQLVQKVCSADLMAFELISSRAIELVSDRFTLAQQLLQDKSDWIVLIELSSMDSEEKVRLDLQNLLMDAMDSKLVLDGIVADSIQQSKTMWGIRETIPEAQLQLGTVIKHDISLPISELSRFIQATGTRLKESWSDIEIIVFGHVGYGNLHYNIVGMNLEISALLENRRGQVNQLVHDQVYLHNGSFSAEPGIGQSKVTELSERKSVVEMTLMRAIKKSLDPLCIMNPNKVILREPD